MRSSGGYACGRVGVPAHLDATSTFTVGKVAGNETLTFEKSNGETVQCHKGLAGSGSFTTTTTGTLNLTFHECTAFGFPCTTAGQPSGTIVTTELTFHLISTPTPGDATKAGVLITPNHTTGVFAHFECLGVQKTIVGNGMIGEITSPNCGGSSNVARVKFTQGATGIQNPTTYTGVNYNLEIDGLKTVLVGEASITFPGVRKLTCTHV